MTIHHSFVLSMQSQSPHTRKPCHVNACHSEKLQFPDESLKLLQSFLLFASSILCQIPKIRSSTLLIFFLKFSISTDYFSSANNSLYILTFCGHSFSFPCRVFGFWLTDHRPSSSCLTPSFSHQPPIFYRHIFVFNKTNWICLLSLYWHVNITSNNNFAEKFDNCAISWSSISLFPRLSS